MENRGGSGLVSIPSHPAFSLSPSQTHPVATKDSIRNSTSQPTEKQILPAKKNSSSLHQQQLMSLVMCLCLASALAPIIWPYTPTSHHRELITAGILFPLPTPTSSLQHQLPGPTTCQAPNTYVHRIYILVFKEGC